MLGMFGKENLEYLSEFDANKFNSFDKQIYYHRGLNSKIYFYNSMRDFLKESNQFFKSFNRCVVFAEDLENKLIDDKIFQLNIDCPNIKKVFIWHYGEVFDVAFVKKIQEIQYDLILSGSKRPILEKEPNFYFDLLFLISNFLQNN